MPSVAEPAIHPRLCEPGALEKLGKSWRAVGAERIDDVLVEGLTAEIAALLPLLPSVAQPVDHHEVTWPTTIELPMPLEPQYPAAFYRVAHFLGERLPAVIESVAGARYSLGNPFAIRVCGFCRGSFIDVKPAAAEGLAMFLWVAAPKWPATWGAQLEARDETGETVATFAPRAGALDLVTAGRYRVTLLERPVRCWALRYDLFPVETSS